MAQTLLQLQKQISALQAKADAVRQAEVKEVVSKIRAAIEVYGLTAVDLFGAKVASPQGKKAGRASVAKFSDGKGNTWGGMGKRPTWLRDALAAGASLDQFRTGSAAPASASSKRVGKKKSAAGKKAAVKYRDGAGNTWSGRGLQPRWLKAAIAAGKKVEEFVV